MIDDESHYVEYTKCCKQEGIHEFFLSDRAIEILHQIEAQNYNNRNGFIFLGKNNNYLLTHELNKNINRACKELGIQKHFSTHTCRRFAATQCALNGMSMVAMMETFGWSDKETAANYLQKAATEKEQKRVLTAVLN